MYQAYKEFTEALNERATKAIKKSDISQTELELISLAMQNNHFIFGLSSHPSLTDKLNSAQ